MDEEIERIIRARKPTLAKLTINQSARHIRRLYHALYPTDSFFDLSKLENTDPNIIFNYINTKQTSTRKNISSSMMTIKRLPEYTDYINAYHTEYTDRINNHIPSERDKHNIVTPELIESVNDRLKRDYDAVYSPDKLIYTADELKIIKKYILFQLISGRHFPPRRSLDWCCFKIKNINESTDNYIHEKEFVFNTYKTAYKYGCQRVAIPEALYYLLMSWILINPYEYLIPTVSGKQTQVSNLYDVINEIMGTTTGIGTTKFRKNYLQTKFGNITKLHDDMADMGTSVGVLRSYITNL